MREMSLATSSGVLAGAGAGGGVVGAPAAGAAVPPAPRLPPPPPRPNGGCIPKTGFPSLSRSTIGFRCLPDWPNADAPSTTPATTATVTRARMDPSNTDIVVKTRTFSTCDFRLPI